MKMELDYVSKPFRPEANSSNHRELVLSQKVLKW
jgi:hypothetical protein